MELRHSGTHERVPLLGSDGRGEALATLGAAALQDCATGLGLHPLTETVLAETLDSAGLKCPLHLCGSSLSRGLMRCDRFLVAFEIGRIPELAHLQRAGILIFPHCE